MGELTPKNEGFTWGNAWMCETKPPGNLAPWLPVKHRDFRYARRGASGTGSLDSSHVVLG